MIEIVHISEAVAHIDTLSRWMCDEWGTENNIDFFKSIVNHSLSKENLPQTFVAMDGDVPVGTIGLWRCDMVSRQDLFPWLSALYVIPEYRKKGIGEKLQVNLIEHAKSLEFENLYLYTDIEGYYEKTGWEYIDKGITYSGEYDQIYRMKL